MKKNHKKKQSVAKEKIVAQNPPPPSDIQKEKKMSVEIFSKEEEGNIPAISDQAGRVDYEVVGYEGEFPDKESGKSVQTEVSHRAIGASGMFSLPVYRSDEQAESVDFSLLEHNQEDVVSVPPPVPRQPVRSPKVVRPMAMIPDGPDLPSDLAQFVASNWVSTMETLQEIGLWAGEIPRSFRIKVGADGSLLLKVVDLPKDVIVVSSVSGSGAVCDPVYDVDRDGGEQPLHHRQQPRQQAQPKQQYPEHDGVPRRTLVVGDDGDIEVSRRR